MEEKKPTWIKVLNWISIIFIILAIISGIIFFGMDFGGIGILLISLPAIIIALLLLSFNFFYYLKKNNKILGNIISIILLIIMIIVFIISTLGLMRIPPFDYWDIAGFFLYPLQIVIVIFLIGLVYFVNKN